MDHYCEKMDVEVGAKVDAALRAVQGGVQAVVIAAGGENGIIDQILRGEQVGTMFLQHVEDTSGVTVEEVSGSVANGSTDDKKDEVENELQATQRVEQMAVDARVGGRTLQAQSAECRTRILLALARLLEERSGDILRENEKDLV
eukprot:gene46748-58288_t